MRNKNKLSLYKFNKKIIYNNNEFILYISISYIKFNPKLPITYNYYYFSYNPLNIDCSCLQFNGSNKTLIRHLLITTDIKGI